MARRLIHPRNSPGTWFDRSLNGNEPNEHGTRSRPAFSLFNIIMSPHLNLPLSYTFPTKGHTRQNPKSTHGPAHSTQTLQLAPQSGFLYPPSCCAKVPSLRIQGRRTNDPVLIETGYQIRLVTIIAQTDRMTDRPPRTPSRAHLPTFPRLACIMS